MELCRVLHPEYDGGTGPPIFQLQGLYESKEHAAASTFLKKKMKKYLFIYLMLSLTVVKRLNI